MFRRNLLFGVVGGSAIVAGCTGNSDRSDAGGGTGTGTSLSISSPAFADGDPLPTRFSCEGEDVSPELAISGVVDEMTSLALVFDDPDAPRDEPYVHWLIWNLPADITTVPEGIPSKAQVDEPSAVQGTNDAGRVGYSGPCPPTGHGPHTYRFHLYGLDTTLELEGGADRASLDAAMDGHVVDDVVYRGSYERA